MSDQAHDWGSYLIDRVQQTFQNLPKGSESAHGHGCASFGPLAGAAAVGAYFGIAIGCAGGAAGFDAGAGVADIVALAGSGLAPPAVPVVAANELAGLRARRAVSVFH